MPQPDPIKVISDPSVSGTARVIWDDALGWEQLSDLPRTSAVYGVFCAGQCLYVGSTADLRRRFIDHHRKTEFNQYHLRDGLVLVCWRNYEPSSRLAAERAYIRALKPKRNWLRTVSKRKPTIQDERRSREARKFVDDMLKRWGVRL